MAEPFDLDRIRRNWDLLGRHEPATTPGRLDAVEPPLDLFLAARADLATVRSLLRREGPAVAATLAPFVDRIESAIDRLDAVLRAGNEAAAAAREGPTNEAVAAPETGGEAAPAPAPAAPPEDPAKLREKVHEGLCDLEDMLEVFLFVTKKGA